MMNVRPTLLSVLAAGLASLGGAAHALATTQYTCTGYRPLTTEITPQEAQVHFEGHDWTLKRVHDNGEARYVNTRAGVSIITKGRELTFLHEPDRLKCKLDSEALGGPKPPPSAPSAVLSSSAPVATAK